MKKMSRWWRILAAGLWVMPSCSTVIRPECDRRANSELTGAMYEMLGIDNEYMGHLPGAEQGSPMIEAFYGSEVLSSSRFAALLREHADSRGIARKWQRVGKPGEWHCYQSAELAPVFNAFYTRKEKSPTLNPAVFKNATHEDKIRFIRGAYLRWGGKDKDSSISMPNAPWKIHTVAAVLKDLGCQDIRIFRIDYTPVGWIVTFTPTAELRQQLHIQKETSGDAFFEKARTAGSPIKQVTKGEFAPD